MANATKSRRYFTLAVREEGQWAIHFGDYDRDVVIDEQADICEHQYRRADTKVISSGDSQADIDAAIAALNA